MFWHSGHRCDDVDKAFATNALFIPSQDDGGTDRTDSDCTNDPLGCWSVDHGVVDMNWTTRSFPNNIPWDYGYYVGSASDDPIFTYCQEAMSTEGSDNHWLGEFMGIHDPARNGWPQTP